LPLLFIRSNKIDFYFSFPVQKRQRRYGSADTDTDERKRNAGNQVLERLGLTVFVGLKVKKFGKMYRHYDIFFSCKFNILGCLRWCAWLYVLFLVDNF